MNNTEWLKIDEKELQYHTAQYKEPKAYTRHLLQHFESFFNTQPAGSVILDIGCGAGAVTNQFAKAFPHLLFTGIDLNENYIAIANELRSENTSFTCSSLEAFQPEQPVSGCMCLQTLSWLPDYFGFIEALKKIKPGWALVTALFYDGPVDAFIRVKDYGRRMEEINYRESYYNIYSIPEFNGHLQAAGFGIASCEPFKIPIDLPRNESEKGMATYTRKTEDGERLQISGPILMNWHTLLIKRNQ